MDMDSRLAELREELDRYEKDAIIKLGDRAASLRQLPWVVSKEVAGPASEEARDAATYFMTGLSRKLINSSQSLRDALSITTVITNQGNIEMLDSLLLTAYLRGVKLALELTGQTIQPSLENQARQKELEQLAAHAEDPAQATQPNKHSTDRRQPCSFCGLIHDPDDDLPTWMATALKDLGNLSKILGGGPGALLGEPMADDRSRDPRQLR